MQYSLTTESATSASADCVLVGVYSKQSTQQLSAAAECIDAAADGIISRALQLGDIDGSCGQSLLVYPKKGCASARVLLVGLGDEAGISLQQYQKIIHSTALYLQAGGSQSIISFLSEVKVDKLDCAALIGQQLQVVGSALYSFVHHKPSASKIDKPISSWQFAHSAACKVSNATLARAKAIVNGINLARDLGNQPSNVATPKYLGKRAQQLAKQYPSIKTTLISQKELQKMGAGAFVSVAKGSANSGKLIIMEYLHGDKKSPPTVLVGKGITFDTGGISLKPGAGMDEMKFDMCGAASVFGTLSALAELKAKQNVIGIVAAAENMPSAKASKPGDIVTTLSGQTVEILNTDAEGRLVLCDALTYAGKYHPKTVIDIATLTGACVIALGKHASGLMSNDDELAAELYALGQATGDRVWRLPIWEDYQSQLNSNFADMQNIGGREAGSITAACFLARFTKKYRWAHLDIAGSAWLSDANKGATGRPVALLTNFVLEQK